MTLNDFRKELESATQGIPKKHPEAIKSLNIKYPHNIALKCNPNFIDTHTECFKYAFRDRIPQNIINKKQTFTLNLLRSTAEIVHRC